MYSYNKHDTWMVQPFLWSGTKDLQDTPNTIMNVYFTFFNTLYSFNYFADYFSLTELSSSMLTR